MCLRMSIFYAHRGMHSLLYQIKLMNTIYLQAKNVSENHLNREQMR